MSYVKQEMFTKNTLHKDANEEKNPQTSMNIDPSKGFTA